ncbi:hypothetical protein TNCV_2060261 [Trichonephila clavipes]|nr:hypothetical protein TNCV_2060261 [Trichonephila clavipes]
MREDACVRTCQPDYIWSEKLKDFGIADVEMPGHTVTRHGPEQYELSEILMHFVHNEQVNWADIENRVEFVSKEMPNVKVEDNGLFEEIRTLNVY